jgi:hypothetical protein
MRISSEIFCEGFHDRAFWKGWLQTLGCSDPGAPPPGASTRPDVHDPWGGIVSRGRFAFHSPTKHFMRVTPCNGKPNILRLVRMRLKDHSTEPVRRIIVNEDSDLLAGAPAGVVTPASVERLVKEFDPAATQRPNGEWRLFNDTVGVSLILWTANDPPTDGVPTHETLERLITAAICAAHAGRGVAIRDWLASRPLPPPPDVKEFSWSHMAGWYAVMGGEAFYSNLWRDAAIAAQLERRLRASGAWAIVENFVA